MCKLYNETLKMLGLYLYTLIIGHMSFKMLCILNKLILKKNLHNFVTNRIYCVLDLKKTTHQRKKIIHKNPCRNREMNPGHLSECVTSDPPSQLIVTSVVKLSYWTVSTQWVETSINKAELAGHTFSTNSFFSVIFLQTWITIFGSFSYLQE